MYLDKLPQYVSHIDCTNTRLNVNIRCRLHINIYDGADFEDGAMIQSFYSYFPGLLVDHEECFLPSLPGLQEDAVWYVTNIYTTQQIFDDFDNQQSKIVVPPQFAARPEPRTISHSQLIIELFPNITPF